MLTRQKKTVGKALHNTQKKGKAFRIRNNAVLKKAKKDNDDLRFVYGLLKAERNDILRDLIETEDERLKLNDILRDLIKTEDERPNLIQENKKIKKKYMMLKRQMKKERTSFVPYPVKAFITHMMRFFK